MNSKRRISILSAVIMALVITSVVAAQYVGYNMGTAYQLVNTSDGPVTIDVAYYDSNGVAQTTTRHITDLPVGSSVLVVVPKDETGLAGGSYSAVISSSGTIAGIVNEEYYPTGNTTNPHPPFADYSAASEGSTSVFLPAVMYNYFNYYTELFIQNVGSADATDVQIEYVPNTVNGVVVGLSVTESNLSIKQNATLVKSQLAMSNLGNPAAAAPFANRFFGSVKVSSSQPLVVVVNEHNVVQTKLMSYNGFSAGSTKLLSPTALRGWYNYYSNLTVSNTSSASPACVRLTYNPDMSQAALIQKIGGGAPTPVTAEFVIPASSALVRYEGADSSASQSDLSATYTRFSGSVTVESIAGTVSGTTCAAAIPLAAVMNVESKAGAAYTNQAGATNLIPVSAATNKVVIPVALAKFYGYYTTIVIANTTSTAGTCTTTYTSAAGSSVPGVTKAYTRPLAANGSITIYEGAADARSDLNADASWGARFIGAATIECKDASNAPIPVVATENEEVNLNGMDSMYSINTINK
jgi:hypothetical protein